VLKDELLPLNRPSRWSKAAGVFLTVLSIIGVSTVSIIAFVFMADERARILVAQPVNVKIVSAEVIMLRGRRWASHSLYPNATATFEVELETPTKRKIQSQAFYASGERTSSRVNGVPAEVWVKQALEQQFVSGWFVPEGTVKGDPQLFLLREVESSAIVWLTVGANFFIFNLGSLIRRFDGAPNRVLMVELLGFAVLACLLLWYFLPMPPGAASPALISLLFLVTCCFVVASFVKWFLNGSYWKTLTHVPEPNSSTR
jgi:hypothetical protein